MSGWPWWVSFESLISMASPNELQDLFEMLSLLSCTYVPNKWDNIAALNQIVEISEKEIHVANSQGVLMIVVQWRWL